MNTSRVWPFIVIILLFSAATVVTGESQTRPGVTFQFAPALAFMTWGVATMDEKGAGEGYTVAGHSGPEVESPWCREPVR